MVFDDKMLVIRRDDFFVKLTDEEYESLNITHNFVTVDRNGYIYFDAQNYSKLYFVKEGYVKIGNVDEEGNETVIDILKPGDVFGQFTLEKNDMKGEYALAYRTDVSLCSFSISDFETLLSKRPELSIAYSKKVGRQMRRINNRLISLLQKDARTRLLYFLWTLLQHGKHVGTKNPSINNYLTHEDMARLIGTSRQTVTTLLNQFVSEGLVEVTRKQIVVKDLKLLQQQIGV